MCFYLDAPEEVTVNQAFLDIVGYDAEEVQASIKDQAPICIHPEDALLFRYQIVLAAKHERTMAASRVWRV